MPVNAKYNKITRLLWVMTFGLGMVFVVPSLMRLGAVRADPGVLYVTLAGEDDGNCSQAAPCRTLQYAVDVARTYDEIRLAQGTYTGVHTRTAPVGYLGTAIITQVAYITKPLTVRGGYSADFDVWDPTLYPTVLDAEGDGRVVMLAGEITTTLESLHITGGAAAGLGGDYSSGTEDAGGGIYVLTATLALEDCYVANNTAYYGGGLFLWGSDDAVMRNNVIQGNVVNEPFSSISGVYLVDSDSVILDHNTIRGNAATGRSGAVKLLRSDHAILSSNIITANVGGGLEAWQSHDLILTGNAIHNNSSSCIGGGILFYEVDAAKLVGNTIAGNAAVGGLGHTIAGNTTVNNLNRTIPGSVSAYACAGGGLYLLECEAPTLHDNVIRNNSVHDDFEDVYGGGIYLHHTYSATLSGNTILSNTASGGEGVFGGGIGGLHGFWDANAMSTTITLTNNIIQGNVVSGASSLDFSGGGAFLLGVHVVLKDNVIQNNTAHNDLGDAYGGGVCFGYYSLTSNNDIIRGNTADYGGGLFLPDVGDVTLSNTLIQSNTATYHGGGIYFMNTNAKLDNMVIADNYAKADGSGIYMDVLTNSLHLRHTTLARNGRNALSIGGDDSTVMLTNTILVSHTVGVIVAGESKAQLNGILWYGNVTDTMGTGDNITITHQITGDPAFAADGYHLSPASPAVDAGLDAGLARDIDGDPRPIGFGPDLGADECLGVRLAPDRAGNAWPGGQGIYTHTLTNDTPVSLTFAFSATSSLGWDVALSFAGHPSHTLLMPDALAPGASAVMTVSVQVPANAVSGIKDTTWVTATAQGSPNLWATATDTTLLPWTLHLPLVLRSL